MASKERFVWYKHGLGTVVLCVLIAFVLSYTDVFSAFNEGWIDRDVRDQGIQGAVYFVVVATMLTACGAPRQVMAFLGGYAFGFVSGALLATLATVLGCMLAFFASKLLIRPFIRKRFARKAKQIDSFLHYHPFRKTIIIRLLPVGSNIMTNLLAGTTSVKASAFFVGSALGYLPQMVIFALLGKGLFIGSEWKIAVSILLLLVSSFMSVSLYKKYRREEASLPNAPMDDCANTDSKSRA
ncbi:TVP38/TMEM64 family protein [Glaciecola sp. SC05]|uniref:TVP38/TMEM64 family protein n=1 Tax=Glaciecola sp. SC05 TaxID=1987355 RepID=UPI003529D2B9